MLKLKNIDLKNPIVTIGLMRLLRRPANAGFASVGWLGASGIGVFSSNPVITNTSSLPSSSVGVAGGNRPDFPPLTALLRALGGREVGVRPPA